MSILHERGWLNLRRHLTSAINTGERGDVTLAVMLFMMIFCVLAVVGFDFSRAHAVRERLKTATDAAALAAVMQARQIPDQGSVVMYDSGGNVTTDPAQAVSSKMQVSTWDMDLSDPGVQQAAATAAAKAFTKNLLGSNIRISQVVTPQVAGLPAGTSSAALPFQAGVDWNAPRTSASGTTYYNQYKVTAGLAVKTFMMAGLFSRILSGKGVISGSAYGQSWRGVIPINAMGTSQAMTH